MQIQPFSSPRYAGRVADRYYEPGVCVCVSCARHSSFPQKRESGKERMRKEEKRRKFHDALMNIYSPPQPPHLQKQPIQLLTSSIMNQQIMPEPVDFECDGLCMDPVSEVNNLAKETSSDDVGECVPQKLTRAQRKRIRKKKLKEDASRRRKIIGPLLPTHEDVECEPFNNQNKNVQKTIQAQDISIKTQDSS